MTPRRDTRAPARLADLRALVQAWVADAADPPRALVAALGAAPAASDPALAALAEEALVATCLAEAPGLAVPRAHVAAAVRTGLARLAAAHPGQLVEVRVPPHGAVQVGVPGQASAHTRGTPPNVVETDPSTWLALASGRLAWADAVATRRVQASGAHADLGPLLPAARPSPA